MCSFISNLLGKSVYCTYSSFPFLEISSHLFNCCFTLGWSRDRGKKWNEWEWLFYLLMLILFVPAFMLQHEHTWSTCCRKRKGRKMGRLTICTQNYKTRISCWRELGRSLSLFLPPLHIVYQPNNEFGMFVLLL